MGEERENWDHTWPDHTSCGVHKPTEKHRLKRLEAKGSLKDPIPQPRDPENPESCVAQPRWFCCAFLGGEVYGYFFSCHVTTTTTTMFTFDIVTFSRAHGLQRLLLLLLLVLLLLLLLLLSLILPLSLPLPLRKGHTGRFAAKINATRPSSADCPEGS